MMSFRVLRIKPFAVVLFLFVQCGIALADAPPSTMPSTQPGAPDKTAAGYLTATIPRAWSFPRDHGRHDGFKTEWWYFSGNVADGAGKRFGFQLTFFRVAISPIFIPRTSIVSLGDYYFAHAAVSDLTARQFYFKDRMDHEAAGIAASDPQTLNVSLRDWSAKLTPGTDGDAVSLDMADPAFTFHLNCNPGIGPVLQGPGGVNPKGRQHGQASYYYSMPRMPTAGTLTVKGQTFHVTGKTWMDHEFSSNALGPNQVGWDWVGLQLADGQSLMVYRLRNKAGGADFLSGTLIDATGHPKYLTDQQVTFAPSSVAESIWKSDSGGAYPQLWTLTVPGLPALTIHSRMPGQELRTDATTRIDYFEGSCDVATADGKPAGEGYLEMTGYAKPIDPF